MPYVKITSTRNTQIKEVLALREPKVRKKTGLTIVEGLREASRAFASGIEFKELYFCRSFLKGKEPDVFLQQVEGKGARIMETTKEVFEKISFGDRQEGVLAVCRSRILKFTDLKLNAKPLLVVTEALEKPGNLGAILRTCDGAGVDALIVADGLTDIFNPNVVRSSLGTVFSVPVVHATNDETLTFLKKINAVVCAASPDAGDIYYQKNLDTALAVVVGSEQKGLSAFWDKNASLKVRVPMQGIADSLNASITAAVIIYEAFRQRNK